MNVGFVDDLHAVFGCLFVAELPALVSDGPALALLAWAKPGDDVPPLVWRRVAALVVESGELDDWRRPSCRRTAAAAVRAADALLLHPSLPVPPPRPFDLPAQPAPGKCYSSGPHAEWVNGLRVRLTGLLAERHWCDPVQLAGELEDLRDALTDWLDAARRWRRAEPLRLLPAPAGPIGTSYGQRGVAVAVPT